MCVTACSGFVSSCLALNPGSQVIVEGIYHRHLKGELNNGNAATAEGRFRLHKLLNLLTLSIVVLFSHTIVGNVGCVESAADSAKACQIKAELGTNLTKN